MSADVNISVESTYTINFSAAESKSQPRRSKIRDEYSNNFSLDPTEVFGEHEL